MYQKTRIPCFVALILNSGASRKMSHLVVGIGPGSTAEQRFKNRYRSEKSNLKACHPEYALSSQISCPHLDNIALDQRNSPA